MKLKTFFSKKEDVCNSSKVSFFNKTIFFKNVTLFWPLWAVYTLALFIALPISLWLDNSYDGFMYTQIPAQDRLYDLVYQLDLSNYLIVIIIAAVLFGMGIFHYMYNAKSANMVHALPVDRRQLFGTNLISGWTFLIVPQIAAAVFAFIVCICYDIPKGYCVFWWLILVMGISVVFYSVVTVCAMLTGLLLALPVYVYIAMNFFYWMWAIYSYIRSMYGFGIDTYFGYGDKVSFINLLSPYYAIAENVGIDNVNMGNANYPVWEIKVSGVPLLLIYLVVAALLYFVAYKIYQKRHIEQAGDLLTVSKLKPIFRWGVGTTGGVFVGLFVKSVLEETGLEINLAVTVILVLLLGGLCYFFAEMFVKKSFHVFKRKNWIGCAKFTCILFASFFVCFGIVKYEENYIPELKDIEEVTLYSSYEIKFTNEDSDFIIDIHEKILEQKNLANTNRRKPGVSYSTVRITYELKDGRVITRRYLLPMEGEIKQIFAKISEKENSPETFINSYMRYEEYLECKRFEGYISYSYIDEKGNIDWTNDYVNEALTVKFYEAAIKDAKAGTLMKYNRQFYYDYDKNGFDEYYENSVEEYIYSNTNITIYFKNDDGGYYNRSSLSLSFGPDCENLVQVMLDYGLIDSVDEIYWK